LKIGTVPIFCLALLAAGAAFAQAYPAKPVRIIVATGPGGGDDFAARQLAMKLSEVLGQQFIVENRPGAGGMIGQTYVAKSRPDGYTLLLAGGSMAGARYVNANMGYDLARDFTPVSLIESSPFVLVINPALPVKSVNEFAAIGRSHPGKLSFGTLGAGQIPYWAAVLFNSMAGVQAVEVQYKSITDAIADIIAGRLDYAVVPMVNAVGNREKLRALAVTTRDRAELLADVPAMAEALQGYDMPAWRSIMGPAGMSAEIVRTLNQAIAQSLTAPDLRERFARGGFVPVGSTPEELRKRYEDWSVIFGKIARDVGIQPH
jgi:tripartite-type tricarboxylate transporter receptor subunit TctC